MAADGIERYPRPIVPESPQALQPDGQRGHRDDRPADQIQQQKGAIAKEKVQVTRAEQGAG